MKKIRVGDRVWFLLPHNGEVTKISESGGFEIKIDVITEDTFVSWYREEEIEKLNTKNVTKKRSNKLRSTINPHHD